MRLIHVDSILDRGEIQLEELIDETSIPSYVILSHTWGWEDENTHTWGHASDEITFQDVSKVDIARQKHRAFEKVKHTCRIARSISVNFVWIDTCCIDKSSSAELSEGINSMFAWYQKARLCVAHLSDVDTVDQMGVCRWFRRGWTLQELIAPTELRFFNRAWMEIGDKLSLQDTISRITNIEIGVLSGEKELCDVSIAQRMSWASKRQTSRPEDRAYSLLGIFGTHLPMIYGEGGRNAFVRLQEEIIKNSADLSIFAWGVPEVFCDSGCSMLAESPDQFEHATSVRPYFSRKHFLVTNRGILIESRWRLITASDGRELIALPVNSSQEMTVVYIRKLDINTFVRVGMGYTWKKDSMNLKIGPFEFYIRQSLSNLGHLLLDRIVIPGVGPGYYTDRFVPEAAWDLSDRSFVPVKGVACGFRLTVGFCELVVLLDPTVTDSLLCELLDYHTSKELVEGLFDQGNTLWPMSWGRLATYAPFATYRPLTLTVYEKQVLDPQTDEIRRVTARMIRTREEGRSHSTNTLVFDIE